MRAAFEIRVRCFGTLFKSVGPVLGLRSIFSALFPFKGMDDTRNNCA